MARTRRPLDDGESDRPSVHAIHAGIHGEGDLGAGSEGAPRDRRTGALPVAAAGRCDELDAAVAGIADGEAAAVEHPLAAR